MARSRLPDTRPAVTHKFRIGEQKGYLSVGLAANGQPLELFIKISKQGSTIGGFASALARLTSISLQHGVPLAVICQKMRGLRFEPMGCTPNRDIPQADSIVDYIFSWLELKFITRPEGPIEEPIGGR